MVQAPETIRQQPLSNNSSSSTPPLLSISTILSRSPRLPVDGALPGNGPFYADRRAMSSIRRNFSGGPRPAPFVRNPDPDDADSIESARTLLLSALEARRRRVQDLRQQASQTTNIATTITEQWRRSVEGVTFVSSAPQFGRNDSSSAVGSTTTPRSETRLLSHSVWNDEASDTDFDEDEEDSDNKFSNSMNDVHRTSPSLNAPRTSPSNHCTGSPTQDDDSSRNAYTLSCRFCANVLTKRGMRARLVADARVHIWSTDEQPQ